MYSSGNGNGTRAGPEPNYFDSLRLPSPFKMMTARKSDGNFSENFISVTYIFFKLDNYLIKK
jgi:hypothetical protein